MQLISNRAKKLLKDLDNFELWEDGFLTVRHKTDRFEVWYSTLFRDRIIWKTDVKFNLIERILITRKVRKLKKLFWKSKESEKIIPEYFK